MFLINCKIIKAFNVTYLGRKVSQTLSHIQIKRGRKNLLFFFVN